MQPEREFLSYWQWRQHGSRYRSSDSPGSRNRWRETRWQSFPRAPPLWNNFPVRWIDANCRRRKGQVDRSKRRRGQGYPGIRTHPGRVSSREQPPFWMARFSLYASGYNVMEAWCGTKSSSAYRYTVGLAFDCVCTDDRRRNCFFFLRIDTSNCSL